MKVIYNNNLKDLARKNRKSGNLSEVILWSVLKGRKLMGLQWTRQKPVLDFIVDFYCSKYRIAIEIDGSSHLDQDKDSERQRKIEGTGIRFIRIPDIDVKTNLNGVVKYIESEVLKIIEQPPNPLF